jgi:hypothetical protein
MNKLNPSDLKKLVETQSENVQKILNIHKEQHELLCSKGCPNKIKNLGQQFIDACQNLSDEEADIVNNLLFKGCECGRH